MPRPVVRATRTASLLPLAVAFALAGCGFVASGERGSTKPDGFLLRGYVSVGVAADPAATAGAACVAPAGVADIASGGAVRVADPEGRTLGTGVLKPGLLSHTGGAPRCEFPFEVPGVPGGVDRYVVGVGNRPPVSFRARELRENKPAVITVDT